MAEKKVGLGRGIGALIPTSPIDSERPIDVFFGGATQDRNSTSLGQPLAEAPSAAAGTNTDNLVAVPGARFAHLDVNAIVPNAQQPRAVFEPEAFAELVHSVREFGVLQPIVVRSLGKQNGQDQYELIMGERRLRASKEAGLAKIPAVIRDTADENMLRDALLENIHRANLNPLEEASAYQQLLSDFGITQEQLAEKIGRSRPQITNTLRLLKLPIPVQQKVAAGVLSAGHARAILALPDADRMTYFAEKVIKEGLSVRSLEELVAIDKPKPGKAKILPGGRQDALKEIADRLGDRLNTKVSVVLGKKKGQLIIDFATVADLNRILKELGDQ
ncbi:ParB/RepB/Spo0J family partition protein [Candidatus Rhodoluna planktonica]|uniref:Chromosome partitioning protein ParB n=1 Tax=Candidatus Rhodoluna planktonica TaxID=535712 RepID=A0A1D9E0R0_9MICO|nr:ParB/RepB/Spo0J family partition protein [Candidatus Rhodoluna planktonica]AOY56653.1 chromosome partitioning protein ParB [Candidatus Rhodoluna planktonica]